MAALVSRDMSVEKHSFSYFGMSLFSKRPFHGESDRDVCCFVSLSCSLFLLCFVYVCMYVCMYVCIFISIDSFA